MIYKLTFVTTYRCKNIALAILHLCEWLYRVSKPNNNNNNNNMREMDYFNLFHIQQQSWHYIYTADHHGFV